MTFTIPQLLHHAASAIPFPTNTTDALLAIRFPSPVRIASIRIAPEGVSTISGIGSTYPTTFKARLFSNTSTAQPVNALTTCELDVVPAEHELDYPIDMPEGVSTRLLLLQSPAERITISVYGFIESSGLPAEETEPDPISRGAGVKEDWRWVHTWAGETESSLLDLLNDSTHPSTLPRALQCLDLLCDLPNASILQSLLDHPDALPFLLSQPSYPPQPLLQRLYSDPDYALHLNLRYLLPPSHSLRPITHATSGRQYAWTHLELGLGALTILAERETSAEELNQTPKGQQKSNLARLLNLALQYTLTTNEESQKSLELILDILDSPTPGPIIMRQLCRHVPRLMIVSRLRGSQRMLSLSSSYARWIIKSLIELSTEVIDGKAVWEDTKILAEPYLILLDDNDPLRLALSQPTLVWTSELPHNMSINGEVRRLARLSSAMSQSTASSTSMVHQANTLDLLSLIAPTLLTSLQSAPIPPLGISTTNASMIGGQASTWAGKVYSQHEFRKDKETASGLSSNVRISRPASRHVDEWRTA